MAGTENSRQTTTSSAVENPSNVAINNPTVAEDSSNYQRDSHSYPYLSDVSTLYLRRMLHVYRRTSPQKASPVEVSSNIKTFQPYRFLDMPPEIRLKVYELIVGGNQRVHIKSDLENIEIPHTIIPCSDHGSAGCFPKILRCSRPDDLQTSTHCQGAALFSQILCPSYEASHANRQSVIVSYDMQTGKQQTATNNVTSNEQSALCQDRIPYTGRMLDLRLLRTCRQIYDEARSVLYHSNTFVFLNCPTFAAYFGLVFPEEVNLPRSTEPNRLRAIQAMTKVELHSQIGDEKFLDLLSTSRLIRTGLGCLTSLANLELNLAIFYIRGDLPWWWIDDYMFSKPSSLRKLVVDVQDIDMGMALARRIDESRILAPGDHKLDSAKELMRRMLKQEGFRDTSERFWPFSETAASKAEGEEMGEPFART